MLKFKVSTYSGMGESVSHITKDNIEALRKGEQIIKFNVEVLDLTKPTRNRVLYPEAEMKKAIEEIVIPIIPNQSLNDIVSSEDVFLLSQPTDCVTCAGAGTAKPSSQKNDKA